MDRLLRLLFEQPLVLFVVLAWLAGLIGKALRTAQKSKQERPSTASSTREPAVPSRSDRTQTRSADDVAREMRRILGMEGPAEPAAPAPLPSQIRRTEVLRPEPVEREPVPVRPTTQERRLPIHVDPHVGEGIQHRHAPDSGRVGRHDPAQVLGNLGGRALDPATTRRIAARPVTLHRATTGLVDLRSLKRSFVMNEILGKPLALRRDDNRGS